MKIYSKKQMLAIKSDDPYIRKLQHDEFIKNVSKAILTHNKKQKEESLKQIKNFFEK